MLGLQVVCATALMPGPPLAMRCIYPSYVICHRMSMPVPEPDFGEEELSRAWKRTGKGLSRWSAGDKTGDSTLDARLLWSSLILNPPTLQLRDGLDESSLQAALVLGWLKIPFTIVLHRDEQSSTGLARKAASSVTIAALDTSEGPLPRLSGAGIPGADGLTSVPEICSFASGVAKDVRIASATERTDLASWMSDDDSTVDEFVDLLRGRLSDNSPCLNEWGLSMDDAKALPVLVRKIESSKRAPDDLALRLYVDTCLEKAGIVGLFGLCSE
mmetsp:Transcript_26200/g.52510  ORF Transcript_26200/g.52510 Transcript_26200/m.52510 type:complete len:272 (-) Transcript_26200:232-1047(-)